MKLLPEGGACLWLLLLVTGAARAAEPVPPLTLDECVRRALERGFDMQIQRFDVAIARQEVPVARSDFDPQLSAGIAKGAVRAPDDGLLPRSRSQGIDSRLGVEQRLSSGAQVGIDVNLGRSTVDPVVAALNPAYNSAVTLALRQPLLRGLGRAINTAPIRRAQIGTDSAVRSYQVRALEVIRATEEAYYLLAGAREQREVFKASLTLAQTLHDEARGRQVAGVATRLDVLQAEVGVANARRSVLEAENAVQAREDALLALIGQFELDSPLGQTVLDDAHAPPLPQVESSYALALEQQPDISNTRAALELARLDVATAKDALKPALDFELAVGLDSDERTAPDAFSRAFGAAGGRQWQAGLTLRVPLGRAGEKARYRQSQAALDRDELSLRQREQEILVSVREAVRDVETGSQSVKIAALAAKLGQQQHVFETARFRAGLSTSRRVLEAQTDLERARVAHLQARLDLQVALAALRRIEGSAFSRYGIAWSDLALADEIGSEPSRHLR